MGVEADLLTKIGNGELRKEATQIHVAQTLDRLLTNLRNYKPKRRAFGRPSRAPKGLYIYGRVGRGKSMLMDMFFEQADIAHKSRVHFHAFMQDVHGRIQAWRKMDHAERRRHKDYVRGAGDDPIAPVAKHIARSATLLCFDEFHVSDITDAMILSRLFGALLERGVVLVATSNRAPTDLYKDGLNRDLFLPFIKLLKQKLDVISLDGETDHRRQQRPAENYFTPLGPAADQSIDRVWQSLTREHPAGNTQIKVKGRTLTLLASGQAARSDFHSLCETPLGAADYLAIADTFKVLILENVPILTPEHPGAAKRFATLVDVLYEAGKRLILSADAEPDALYPQGIGSFEFARTASRLMEMRTGEYLKTTALSETS